MTFRQAKKLHVGDEIRPKADPQTILRVVTVIVFPKQSAPAMTRGIVAVDAVNERGFIHRLHHMEFS